jgi:hypothetical protein
MSMRITKHVLAALALLLLASTANAQSKLPAETNNAALRYWLAFAEMKDAPADKATTELLEKTASGDAAWDEAKLSPILDANAPAIEIMQRATRLPQCDWGLEYDLGPRASIAYAPRARVLARLNTLYGMRLLAKGDTQGALDTWLSGIRFSRHLSKGGTLIFSLIAKTALVSNAHALAAHSGMLNASQLKRVEAVVRTLPETGFDWSKALAYEEDALDIAVAQMKQAPSPADYYRQTTGETPPENFTAPSSSDIAAFHAVMSRAVEALRLPPQDAQDQLKDLQQSVKNLHVFYQRTTPSFTRINSARAEVQAARQKLL